MRLLTALVLASSFLGTSTAIAADPIGTILQIEGTAHVTHEGTEAPASQGMDVYLDDVIETDEASKILILFKDDTHITLAEDSALQVDEYIYDPENTDMNKGEFDFLKGAFLWTSVAIAKEKPENVTLNTSIGSIGIRGTVVWGGTLNEKYGVFVQEGAVKVTGKWGVSNLGALEGIFASETKLLRGVRVWNEPMINDAVATISFEDMEAIKATLETAKDNN